MRKLSKKGTGFIGSVDASSIVKIENNSNSNLITLLVDGNYLLKASYEGTYGRYTNTNNVATTYQFLIKLRKLIKDFNINKCIVFFDGENSGKLRYQKYRLYKSNRDNKSFHNKIVLTEAEIKNQEKRKEMLYQKVRIQNYIENLFIRQIECEYIESDDLIAFYCKEYSEDENIIIFSNDRDFCQLLEYNNVNVYLDNKGLLINKNNYFLNFNHSYENARLIKIMCGDTSDCIKGIAGLGETSLLKYFPEIITQKVNYNSIIDKSKLINEERKLNKEKPLKVLENIEKGIFLELGELGIEGYKTNEYIINLLEPLLTKEAISELHSVAENILNPNDRGSKDLIKLMNQDNFFLEYKGDINSFCTPFYPLILKEKEYYNKHK